MRKRKAASIRRRRKASRLPGVLIMFGSTVGWAGMQSLCRRVTRFAEFTELPTRIYHLTDISQNYEHESEDVEFTGAAAISNSAGIAIK
jgi:hypothetical protein